VGWVQDAVCGMLLQGRPRLATIESGPSWFGEFLSVVEIPIKLPGTIALAILRSRSAGRKHASSLLAREVSNRSVAAYHLRHNVRYRVHAVKGGRFYPPAFTLRF
jgi:hypothetical protein